jgi:hypothetical protein
LQNQAAENISLATSPEAVSSEANEELASAGLGTKGKGRGINFELGVNGGIFYGGNIWLGEVRAGLPLIIGPARSSLRIMTGLVQSPDQDRKFIPAYADILLNYPPGIITGTNNYFGAGINYVVLTNGRKAGSIGGEIFYGVETEGFNGKIYGEVGYQVIRTGFSASEKGISLIIGYRIPMAF